MHQAVDVARIRCILERAAEHSWRVQDIGVLAMWLDDEHRTRLHVWDPASAVGEPPIHDYPFDFTSTIVAGELVNTRFTEDASGVEYVRERYVPGHEPTRRADTVRLTGVAETLRPGDRYRQSAHELHDSRQVTGTVTVLHFDEVFDDLPELTVCRRPGTPWVTSQPRAASPDEVRRVTTNALARFERSRP